MILFDDGQGDLSPLCDLRASFDLRTGALRTFERLERQAGKMIEAMWVDDRLAALTAERHTGAAVNQYPAGDAWLWINGRCHSFEGVGVPQGMNEAIIDATGGVVAARLDRRCAETFTRNGFALPAEVSVRPVSESFLLTRPWHVLQRLRENLLRDAALMPHLMPLQSPGERGVTVVGDHPVCAAETAVVHPMVVIDTTQGPVMIDERAEVRSMSVLVGPAYIGEASIIANHAHLRANTVIGPVCKVGGEVNSCLFQGYANKAHGGYLGNSFVGEWVNLGASTVTSNLKNTYGEIRMKRHADRPAEPTGMTALGSILGDHVKTAIGTRLNTGSCIHTGAMIALSAIAPKHVGPFAFLTDAGEQRYDFDKFCEVAAEVMRRRDEPLTDAMRAALKACYEQ